MKPTIIQMTAVLIVARTEIRLLDVSSEVETEALEYCADCFKKGHSGWCSIRRAVRKAKKLNF